MEVIFVDGGSTDGSKEFLVEHGFQVISSDKGRARQMNAGTKIARGESVLFLHADTRLPEDFEVLVPRITASTWGFFHVKLDAELWIYRWVSAGINFRARTFGVATGDQAIFVAREQFTGMGGYRQLELMEDIDLSRRLKRVCAAEVITQPVTTSARRWQHKGPLTTIVLMWSLQLAFKCGVSTARIARWYR